MRTKIKNSYPKDFFSSAQPARKRARNQTDNVVPLRESYERQYGERDRRIHREEEHEAMIKRRSISVDQLPVLMSVPEIARTLGRVGKDGNPCIRHVYKLVKCGKLKGFKEGKNWRAYASDVLDYLERLRAG